VLTALHDRKGPMNHDEVMHSLAGRGFDKASVWRILSELSDKDLLRRMDLGDRVWRYELFDQCRTIEAQHPHFLCMDCGDVTCLPTLTVHAQNGTLPSSLRSASFRVRLEGTCGACA
jgi:Fur family ferric uptake transcriptional regulator